MLARVRAVSIVGLDAFTVEVETDLRPSLPKFVIVGLPDASLKESQERVESAIKNTDLEWPMAKIVVNLAPADLRKEGTAFDLPIALAILCANGQCEAEALSHYLIAGELSLDGSLRPVHGVLPMALQARKDGLRGVIVPAENASEAAVIEGIEVIGATHLGQLVSWARGYTDIEPTPPRDIAELLVNSQVEADFNDVKGQEHAKRALEVAAAGGHNILMVGPPGSGKTMLAKRLPGILPDLSVEESLDVTRIYSVAGLLDNDVGLVTTRPFRAPHHTASIPGVIGGGSIPRPGEISLAHHGVLFLDEMPEMSRTMLETLRQPLEDGQVTISRANLSLTFPSRFILVGAMNPCPCGYYGDPVHACTCGIGQIQTYRQRLSGPLLDRIDMTLEVARLPVEKLAQDDDAPCGESSAEVKVRVMAARRIQMERNIPVQKPSSASVPACEMEGEKVQGSREEGEGRGGALSPPDPGGAAIDSPGTTSGPGRRPQEINDDRQTELTDFTGEGKRDEGRGKSGEGDGEGEEVQGSREEGDGESPVAQDSVPAINSPGTTSVPGRGTTGGPACRPITTTNASLTSRQVKAYCRLDDAGRALLTRAVERLGLSARAYERIRKVARTIADLEGSEHIGVPHLAEAIQYRSGEERLRG